MPDRRLRADPIELARQHWIDAGWPEAADGMALVTSIMRVQQVLLARVEDTLRPFDVTFARYEVLMLLRFSRTGSLPVGKIGERLQVHPASVTNAVQRLESAALVVRSENPLDGRSVLATITPLGAEVAARATAELNRAVFAALEVSGDDQRTMLSVLRRWRQEFGDFA